MYHSLLTCPLCADARTLLVPNAWTLDQGGAQHQPRVWHGVSSPVLLIRRIYKCPCGHLVPAHSPAVLRQLPSSLVVPFWLSHRSGYTQELETFIHQHLNTTVSARGTCQSLVENQQKFHRDRCQLYSVSITAGVQPCSHLTGSGRSAFLPLAS